MNNLPLILSLSVVGVLIIALGSISVFADDDDDDDKVKPIKFMLNKQQETHTVNLSAVQNAFPEQNTYSFFCDNNGIINTGQLRDLSDSAVISVRIHDENNVDAGSLGNFIATTGFHGIELTRVSYNDLNRNGDAFNTATLTVTFDCISIIKTSSFINTNLLLSSETNIGA